MPAALGEGRVILGEDPPANPRPAETPFPSAENRALGEGFAECRARALGKVFF